MFSKHYINNLSKNRVTQCISHLSRPLFGELLVFDMTNRDRADDMNPTHINEPLAVLLDRELTSRYGPIVSNDNLRLVLGYSSMEAFRQALSRKTIPIPVFEIENRRGKFALVKDVATWLAAQRERAFIDNMAIKSASEMPAAEPIVTIGGDR